MASAPVSSLALANAQIRAAQRRHQVDQRDRLVQRRRIQLIDALLTDLEILNLKSMDRVPVAYEARLTELRAVLGDVVPPQLLAGLRTKITIQGLMDLLFDVQEALFALLRPQ